MRCTFQKDELTPSSALLHNPHCIVSRKRIGPEMVPNWSKMAPLTHARGTELVYVMC